ncbi:MAG: cytochrome P450, partial [Flavobacteriaceae bacterium]|nr:cytochrome P450 [Flavobacteriaceae bacterium]
MRSIKTLPVPKGDFITGNLKQFKGTNQHQVLENWVKECGDVYKVRFLTKHVIVSANNTINKEILKQRPEKFRRYGKMDEILSEMDISGVFNAEGNTWRRQRLVTSEALNLKNIKSYYPTISKITERLLNKWIQAEANQTIIDVQKDMMRYT